MTKMAGKVPENWSCALSILSGSLSLKSVL